jgi:parallel beta-helix repeat protein
MKRKNILVLDAVVAAAVALAFVLPGSAAFANIRTTGVTSGNIENTIYINNNIIMNDNNGGNLGYTENIPVTEETDDPPMPLGNTIYVDDDQSPGWYDATHVHTINEGITNATAGDTIYVYNGTYFENVVVNKVVDLTGESRDNVIVDGSKAGTVMKVTVSNVNISSFTLTNSNKYCMQLTGASYNRIINCVSYNNTVSFGAGFRLESNSNYNNIIDCEAYQNDAAYVYGFNIRTSSKYNHLTNCNAYNNDIGIYIEPNSEYNTIENCDVHHNAIVAPLKYGIWTRSSYTTIANCSIHDNQGIGVNLYIVNHCHIENNTFYNHAGIYFALFITQSYDNDIINCVFHDNGESFSIGYGDGNNVTNCEFYDNSGTCLILYLADSNSVTNCDFYNNDDVGLYIEDCENTYARDNSIDANVYGFTVTGSDLSYFYHDIDISNTINGKPIYYIIEQNDFELSGTSFGYLALVSCVNVTAKDSDVDGILLVNTTDSTISNISVHRAEYGIYLDYSAEYNTIIDCDTYDNDYGFYLYDSSNNSISNCKSYDNGDGAYIGGTSSNNNLLVCDIYNNTDYGIYLRSTTSNNTIYHNNVVTNTQNAYDTGSNTWDNGYPSGGNYWSDYIGVDGDGDGIGDTSYNITGGANQDRYPLMYRWGENPPVARYDYQVAENRLVTFNASASYDRDGTIVSYEWDFDDGTNATGMVVNHTYSELGTYNVLLTVTDDDNYEGEKTEAVYIGNDPPELPDQPSGPFEGWTGVEYSFSTRTTDPNDDQVSYKFSWGDGNESIWFGPYDSGEIVEASYTWTGEGYYLVMVKAKDVFNAESGWSKASIIHIATPQPDLDCEGSLGWTGVKPGDTVTESIMIQNIGDPTSELDWEVTEWPGWGTWTFTPASGSDLTPEDGAVTMEVSVIAPADKNTQFSGIVKIVNSEDPNDFCIIPVSLATPKNEISVTSNQINLVTTYIPKVLSSFVGCFPVFQGALNRL